MPRNLVEVRAGKRGVGYQGVVARRSEWPGPPHPRRAGAARLPMDLGVATPHWSREDGQLPSPPGLFANTPRSVADRAGPHAWPPLLADDVRKKRPPRGSGRESSAPSVPDTSPPSNCPREKLQRILSGWSHNSAAKCPSCPVILPRVPV